MTIYELGIGDDLIKPGRNNKAIHDFIKAEKRLLIGHLAPFDMILEVGCSYGRHAVTVGGMNKQYIGIDIVPSYIDKAKHLHKRFEKRVSFVQGNAANLDKIIEQQVSDGKKTLIVFPFNVFGIIELKESFWQTIVKRHIKLAIFNFNNSEEALIARNTYYSNAGFADTQIIQTISGTHFVHERGLDSIAYSADHLKNIFRKYGLSFRAQAFATIGTAYFNF